MRKMMLFLALALVCTLSFLGTHKAEAAAPVKIDTCWMDEAPGFIMWYAKKMGWDKEEGLDVNMLLFASGPAQMEALPSKQWQLGATSTAGYLIGAMRHNAYLVSTNVNEGQIQGIYARPDHPLFQVKGYNPKFPEIYGSPETVKGLTVLYTSQTTVHYMVGTWLERLGLTSTDVKLVNMDQPSAIPAFEKGVGDVVALWAPFTYAAENRGWKRVGDIEQVGALTTSLYIGDRAWCDKNPELVAKFLRVHYRVVDLLHKGITPELVADYQKYMNDFCGIKLSLEDAKLDLVKHPFWSLKDTLALSDDSQGIAQAAQWQLDAAKFFASVGRFSPEELAAFEQSKSFTNKFIKLLQ